MSADKMDCLHCGVQVHRAERKGGSFSRTYPPHPRISAMKDKKWSVQEN